MKHVSAVTEIVIITAMMITFIPLFLILQYQMRMSQYTFLEDKTQVTATAITYTEANLNVIRPDGTIATFTTEVPNLMEPMSYTIADVVMSMVIFDEYAPDSNIICLEERYNKILDMTLFDNFINRDDYIGTWYNSSVDVVDCTSKYLSGSTTAHKADTKVYMNYNPRAKVGTDSAGNPIYKPVWSFDHIFVDRVGIE